VGVSQNTLPGGEGEKRNTEKEGTDEERVENVQKLRPNKSESEGRKITDKNREK